MRKDEVAATTKPKQTLKTFAVTNTERKSKEAKRQAPGAGSSSSLTAQVLGQEFKATTRRHNVAFVA